MATKKNWLIRTKDHYILGPISKKKLEELISNGSLRSTDEICSGNGHWITASEKDLIKKYVIDGVQQEFNPVSEAKRVFQNEIDISEPISSEGDEGSEEEIKFPSADDLSYPDSNRVNTKKTDIYGELKKENVEFDRRRQKPERDDYTLAYNLKEVRQELKKSSAPPKDIPDIVRDSDSNKKKVNEGQDQLEETKEKIVPNEEVLSDQTSEIEVLLKRENDHDSESAHEDKNELEELKEESSEFVEISVKQIEKDKEIRKGKKKSKILRSLILIIISLVLIFSFLFYRGFIKTANAVVQENSKISQDISSLENIKKKVMIP